MIFSKYYLVMSFLLKILTLAFASLWEWPHFVLLDICRKFDDDDINSDDDVYYTTRFKSRVAQIEHGSRGDF